MNLCINARDAMDEVGTLTIDIQTLSIAADQNDIPNVIANNSGERIDVCFCGDGHTSLHTGDYVEVSMKDTGSGMSKKKLARIFEPFYTTKDVGKGTGMGLASAHGIMQDAKGHIIVETEVGKGTIFRLLFKACERRKARRAFTTVEDDTPVRNGSGCILMVDDEDTVLTFMEEMLSNNGYEVKTSVNGEHALNLFQEAPDKYDLVITDQTMPKMTGVDLSKQILDIRSDIPIILCTGYSGLINEMQAKAIGIRAYLKKPTDTKKMLRVIDELLSEVA